jgi:hypothetical protein
VSIRNSTALAGHEQVVEPEDSTLWSRAQEGDVDAFGLLTLVGDGFTVLKLESRYPLASFTRVRAQGVPFYLVHAPGGFYGVGWRWETLTGGYKSRCRLQLDPRRRQFFCTNMRARWDRVGRVLVTPPGAQRGDPLNLAVAKVAWDGHVLLHAGTARFADSRLARELWPD